MLHKKKSLDSLLGFNYLWNTVPSRLKSFVNCRVDAISAALNGSRMRLSCNQLNVVSHEIKKITLNIIAETFSDNKNPKNKNKIHP